jgi:Arc/MetJ-type ribon-helix-helix transcriptional regulator
MRSALPSGKPTNHSGRPWHKARPLGMRGGGHERMKEHGEVNWSEVIRRAIEEYLRRLEETETSIPSERLVEELLKMGLKPDMLEPLSPEDEERLYRDLRERTWERVRSTIQAQS